MMNKLLIMADASSVHTERWCRYFRDFFDVALFSLEPKEISYSGKFFQARRYTNIGVIDYLLAMPKFRAILDDFQPDIVNPHFVVSYGWMSSFFRKHPIVATAWGSDLLALPQKSVMHRMRISRALKHADYCTVDNRNLSDAAARFMPREKIVTILMGVDKGFFESGCKCGFSPKDVIKIIAPRGLQKVYDPQTIIAAAGLLKGRTDIRIDLLGDEAGSSEINTEIKKRSLSETVHLKPMMKHGDFVDSLKNYDIYVSASLSDSTSVALLEAMTAGLFPVVSSIAGNREWITDGENGLMFEAGSARSLADSLIKAIDMRRRYAETAAANRRRIRSKAIWQDNMDRIKDIFIELAKR